MTGCCCVVVMAIPQRMFGGVVFGRCEVGEAMSLPGGIQNMNSSFSAAAPAAATGTSSHMWGRRAHGSDYIRNREDSAPQGPSKQVLTARQKYRDSLSPRGESSIRIATASRTSARTYRHHSPSVSSPGSPLATDNNGWRQQRRYATTWLRTPSVDGGCADLQTRRTQFRMLLCRWDFFFR